MFRGALVALWVGWLCASAVAEPVAVLCHLDQSRVSLWLEGAPRSFQLSPELRHKLGVGGLGSCWEVFSHGDRLESALPRGQHEGCRSALTSFGQFARELNAGNWTRVETMLGITSQPESQAFRLRWARQFVSPDPLDWNVLHLDSDSVEVAVVSMQGALDADETFEPTPTALRSRWQLVRPSPGSAWRIRERSDR